MKTMSFPIIKDPCLFNIIAELMMLIAWITTENYLNLRIMSISAFACQTQ